MLFSLHWASALLKQAMVMRGSGIVCLDSKIWPRADINRLQVAFGTVLRGSERCQGKALAKDATAMGVDEEEVDEGLREVAGRIEGAVQRLLEGQKSVLETPVGKLFSELSVGSHPQDEVQPDKPFVPSQELLDDLEALTLEVPISSLWALSLPECRASKSIVSAPFETSKSSCCVERLAGRDRSHFVASWDQALDVDCHLWAQKMPGITGFSILVEQMDEKYEPTEQEIKDYAEWLGIAEEDTELLWIARQGLKTPLPKPWRPCEASSGEIFFYNPVTGASQWDHPCDEELRQLYLQEKAKKHRKGSEDPKKPEEQEAQEKDCKDGKEETTSVSSIGEEVEEKTPPPSCEAKKSKASMIDEAQSTQKRLSFASESSGSAPSSPVGQEAPDAPAQPALTKKASEPPKKLMPERPNKPPPAKLRPPRPKTDRDLEDAFCKSPSPARSRQSPEGPVQSPPGRSQSPECQGGYATPSPPSPPTPGLSAVLKAEVRDDDISFWSNLENGEETLCQAVSKCSENGGSLEISSLTAVLEPSNSGDNEGASGKASPGDAEAGGSVPHTTLASLQCSLTALEPSSSDNPSGLSTRADPEVGTDGVLHSKTSLVELAEVSGKENQKPCNNVMGSRPLKDITNEIRDCVKLPTTPRSLASSAVDVAAMQRLQWELKEEQEERAVLDRQLAEALTAASMEQLAHSSTKAALRNSQRDVQRLETQLRFKDSEVEHLEAELQKCQSELAMLTAEKKQAETQLKAHQAELTRCKSKPQKKPKLQLPSSKKVLKSDEPAEFLQRRRRELRQQHAELEEERKQWRQEARNCGGAEPSEDLVRTRVVLDARAITLNKKISEYRALQRALTSGALHSPNA
eukprot:Skav223280  [mRNA]  locus=scaffold2998:24065:33075:+ [translate_table: standard]